MTGSGHLTSLFLIVLTGQWKISFPTGLTLTCNVNVLFPAQSREKWKAPPTTMLKKLYLALDGGLIRWKAGGDSEVADREPCMWEKWKAKGSYLFLLLAAPEEWANGTNCELRAQTEHAIVVADFLQILIIREIKYGFYGSKWGRSESMERVSWHNRRLCRTGRWVSRHLQLRDPQTMEWKWLVNPCNKIQPSSEQRNAN